MAFPTTSILDNFNRANEGPPPSASWTDTWLSGSGLIVNANRCAASASGNKDSYWDVTTFGPDSEVFVTIPTIPTVDGNSLRLGIRLAQPGVTTVDGYLGMWQFRDAGVTDKLRLFRIDNGVTTELGVGVGLDMVAGDQFGMEAIGNSIRLYTKSGAGVWTLQRSETDATYNVAGFIGLQIIAGNTVPRLDDFGGGRVLAPQRTLMGVGQ